MSIKAKRLLLLLALAVVFILFFSYDLGRFFSLTFLKSQQEAFRLYYATHAMQTIALFLGLYIFTTALSIPGAAILTLLAGALFGVTTGTVIVSFASTIGATLAFLMARFLLRDWVQARYGHRLKSINAGIEAEGAFYLFGLRLVPLFPFFLVNLLMGLTPIKMWRFFIVSQIGMLPGTVVYVYAGTQLAQINTLQGIVSPGVLIAFTLLGLFPLVAKKSLAFIKAKQQYARFKKPKQFDYDTVVIGAGAAGLVSSYMTSHMKAKVALIEKHQMGGDCLNTGCVPSKALIRTAKLAQDIRRSAALGLTPTQPHIKFEAVMARIHRIIAQIAPHDSVERYKGFGVDCIKGQAKILDPYRVQVDTRTLTTRNIIIATGGRPFVPDIPGLKASPYYTSDTIWSLQKAPKHLIVMGGGPIGCELAQCFHRLGIHTTLVERGTQLLGREDSDVASYLQDRFEAESLPLYLGYEALEVIQDGHQHKLLCRKGDDDVIQLPFDALLVALGRRANTADLGLQDLGIETKTGGTIAHDSFMRTRYSNIFVCGDVAGPYQFTHTSAHQAWYASVNALAHPFKQFKADYRVIPWCTFTEPEIAHVGLNEKMAQQDAVPYEVTTFDLAELDRAIADEDAEGMVKVLTPPGKDKILGATIVGPHAGDILHEFVLAMKHQLGLNKILGTVHIYPTLAEANKYAAGAWRRKYVPTWALGWLTRYFQWRRG